MAFSRTSPKTRHCRPYGPEGISGTRKSPCVTIDFDGIDVVVVATSRTGKVTLLKPYICVVECLIKIECQKTLGRDVREKHENVSP